MARKVLMRWPLGSMSGWELAGLNLFELWTADPDIQPLMGVSIKSQDLAGIDPLRFSVMQPAIAAANQFLVELTAGRISLGDQGAVVIDGFGNFGNGLVSLSTSSDLGVRAVARCVFENTQVGSVRLLESYDSVLCLSQWNATVLRGITNKSVTVIHEGIDHSLFFPGPRSGVLHPERFYVFTGGKVEYRKGQDLVILAFREFAARHADAVLVAAWNSPFPRVSAGFQGELAVPLRMESNGALDLRRWASANGINPRQFIALPMGPNHMMPAVLREMDCALQVSRCEGGTNLPAKEAMACGVPVILANNTGMRDLIDSGNCVSLTTQDPVDGKPGMSTDGWGESRVEEIVDALERLYTDTQMRKRIGARGAQWILERRRTWRDHSSELKAHILSLL